MSSLIRLAIGGTRNAGISNRLMVNQNLNQFTRSYQSQSESVSNSPRQNNIDFDDELDYLHFQSVLQANNINQKTFIEIRNIVACKESSPLVQKDNTDLWKGFLL